MESNEKRIFYKLVSNIVDFSLSDTIKEVKNQKLIYKEIIETKDVMLKTAEMEKLMGKGKYLARPMLQPLFGVERQRRRI